MKKGAVRRPFYLVRREACRSAASRHTSSWRLTTDVAAKRGFAFSMDGLQRPSIARHKHRPK